MSTINKLASNAQTISVETEIVINADGSTSRTNRFTLSNGYVISTVKSMSSTTNDRRAFGTYSYVGEDSIELAILLDDEIQYDIDITYGDDRSTVGDVCGYITSDEAKQVIKAVQALPVPKSVVSGAK